MGADMNIFTPRFTITSRMTAAITSIERARGFLEAARLSADWVREMSDRALILEAHHTTHIEGTRLTLDQATRLLNGEAVPEADPDDVRELLNYRAAFEFVSECLGTNSGTSILISKDAVPSVSRICSGKYQNETKWVLI